jgi:hypothetical protein
MTCTGGHKTLNKRWIPARSTFGVGPRMPSLVDEETSNLVAHMVDLHSYY